MASVKKTAAGKYKIRYRAPDPLKRDAAGRPIMVERSKTITADSKRDAQAIADRIEMEERDTAVSKRHGETLADFLTFWANNRPDTSKGKPPAPKTIHRDKQHVKLINSLIGDVPLQSVSVATFDALVTKLRERDLAPVTVKNVWAVLKKAMRQAWRWDRIKADPSAKATAPSVPKTEATYATVADMQSIAAVLDEMRPDVAALVRVLFYTGCRPSELLAVQWPDIDFDRGTVKIARTVTEAGGLSVREETKTEDSAAIIDLSGGAISALEEVRRDHLERMRHKGLSWNPKRFVWPGRFDLPARPSWVSHVFKEAAKRAGRDHLTLYSLRHGSATYLLERGADVKTVQDHLRHSTSRLTLDTYSHVTERMRARKKSLFDEIG